MKRDADRGTAWTCSNCTFENAEGMWQCEMCSHHKPGESYYCVLVLSKHAAACFVGDSHSLLFFVVDALAGAVVLRWTDSGPAAVQATSTAPLLPMVAGDAGAGAGKRSREDPPSPQHKKLRTRRTARQKGSSTGLEVRVSCLVALLHFACALPVLFAFAANVWPYRSGATSSSAFSTGGPLPPAAAPGAAARWITGGRTPRTST